jgi:serine/threonine protein kinase
MRTVQAEMEKSGSDRTTTITTIPGSTASSSSDALPKHTMIGEFEIVGIIGEGGFGTVYLAIDHSLQRKVALKEYRPSLLATRHGKSVMVRSTRHSDAFEAGLKSFMNEARTLARFDHPALIHVYRVWQQNNTAYMAMPLCEGKSLTMTIRDDPLIATQSWITSVMLPLLEAVGTLHASNIYHRDIAPDNIVIQENGAPMLLDFGAARQIATDKTQALTVMVKPGYAPIEQFADDASMKQGPWTDIYALGATMFFMINGRAPPNSVARLANDAMVPLVTLTGQGYTKQFLEAIDRALAIRPHERPQSVAEFRALIERIPEPVVPRSGAAEIIAAAAAVSTGSMSDFVAPSTARSSAAQRSRVGAHWIDANAAASEDVAPPSNPARSSVLSPALGRAAKVLSDAARGLVTTRAPALRTKKGMQIAVGAAALTIVIFAMTLVSNPFAPPQLPAAHEEAVSAMTSTRAALSPAGVGTADVVMPASAAVRTPADISASTPIIPSRDPGPVSVTQAIPEVTSTDVAGTSAATTTTGAVAFSIRPWGDIMVNGESKGPSPPLKRITLPEGKYRIEINNPGFQTYSTDVQVAPNKSITVSHQFK